MAHNCQPQRAARVTHAVIYVTRRGRHVSTFNRRGAARTLRHRLAAAHESGESASRLRRPVEELLNL